MTLGQGNLLYNRYRVVEILGRGGMGAVYRATDESLGVDVAVKENLFTTDDYARQFRMEAVILAGIRHPNLPRVTDHFVIDDMGQYLVMDYIEGDDLRQRMEKEGPISEEEAIRIGCAACDALTYLHTRKPPILHRDIKLGNIKLSSNGQVYLVDFGLAKMGWAHEETMTGARAMTPGYSPPEQYGSARTDARSDVYSLGATLYASLTGVIPEDSLMRAVDGVILTPLRNHRPEISERLASVLEKAMETAAANRYQSAEEFKEALLGTNGTGAERAIALRDSATPIIVEPASAKFTAKKPASPFWRLTAFFLILLLIAAGAIFLNPSNQKLFQAVLFPPPSLTPTRVASATPAAALLPATSPALTATPAAALLPATSPALTATQTSQPKPSATKAKSATATSVATSAATATGTTVPIVVQPTPQGGGMGQIAYASIVNNIAQIFIVNADGSDPRQLTNAREGACSFDWSPDGTQLVYVSPCAKKDSKYPGGALYVLNIATKEDKLLPIKTGSSFEPAWSPNGDQIAFTSMRATDDSLQVHIFNLSDESITPLTLSVNNAQAQQPSWSPDSSQISYTAIRLGLRQIWTMAADGSAQHQQVRTGGSFSDYLPSWSPDGATLFFTQNNTALSGLSTLRRYNFQTTQVDKILAPLSLSVSDAHFSPDGNWIVYEGSDSKSQDIYIWHIFDGQPQRLTTSSDIDFDPVWRPGTPSAP